MVIVLFSTIGTAERYFVTSKVLRYVVVKDFGMQLEFLLFDATDIQKYLDFFFSFCLFCY